MCLPFDSQLRILFRLRSILSKMFKEYANDNALFANPDNIWGPGEPDDLHLWWKEHETERAKISQNPSNPPVSRTIDQLSLSVAGIHLTLLHQVLIPTHMLTSFFSDAITIASMMNATQYVAALEEFASSTKLAVDELEAHRRNRHAHLLQELRGLPRGPGQQAKAQQQLSRRIEDFEREISRQARCTTDHVDLMLSLYG